MEYKTVSLADQVFERLEADILSGKYRRGECITELKLCEELGVSRTPIREALRRLLQEHLIEETVKGTMVLGITLGDFIDMCAIRMRIEGLAVRGFIDHMTEDSLKLIRDAIDFQEFYLGRDDPDQMRILDGRFHDAIYSHCGSMILRDTLAPLHKKVQKYRRMSMSQSSRAQKSVAEHRQIYDAIVARDGDLAEKLICEHVRNAMIHVIELQEE